MACLQRTPRPGAGGVSKSRGPLRLLLAAVLVAPLRALTSTTQTPMTDFSLKNLVAAYDGIIIDAGPHGPLHDGERLKKGTKLLDLMEAVGKPVVFAVDGVCPEDIERETLERLGLLDAADDFVPLRARLLPRTRAERRAAAATLSPALVGATAAAAVARQIVDDDDRGVDGVSFVSDETAESLRQVFGRVGRKVASLGALGPDADAFLAVLRAKPASLRHPERVSCVVVTGGDAFYDELDGEQSGYVSVSDLEKARGEDVADAVLNLFMTNLAAENVPMLAVTGEYRQLERRGVAFIAESYRRRGGDVEEVNFIGDDAMLLACAMDELARRGARRDRILMLSSEGRPCRAAEWQGVATAFLPDG